MRRLLHLLIVGSFLVPFATVKSCMGDETEGVSYTGIQIFAESGGGMLIAVPVLAAILFVFSFRRRVFNSIGEGLVSAAEALFSGIAVLTTWAAVGLAFLFSRVTMHVGFVVCIGSWIVLYFMATSAAVRRLFETRAGCREPPPPWGAVVAAIVIVVDLVTILVSEPNGFMELFLGIAASLLVGVPFVVAAMLLAVRYRLRRQESG